LAPFEWLEQKVSLKLKQIPLTAPDDTDDESYSFVDGESACHFENLAMKDPRALQEALAKINPTVATFRAAVSATDHSFYVELLNDVEESIDACILVEQVLDQKCGKEAPGLRQFKLALSSIHQLISQDLHARNAEHEVDEELLTEAAPERSDIDLWTSGPIRSRTDAYRRLSEAADYLLRTEPHRPTPYRVRRAVAPELAGPLTHAPPDARGEVTTAARDNSVGHRFRDRVEDGPGDDEGQRVHARHADTAELGGDRLLRNGARR